MAKYFWFKFLLTSLLLIGAGSAVQYLFGYKSSFIIEGASVLSIVLGWLFLFVIAIILLLGEKSSETEKRPAQPQKPVSVLRRLGTIALRIGYAAGFLLLIGFMVGNLIYVEDLRNERIARILATPRTAYAVATVTARRKNRSRSGSSWSALITYQGGTEQINQAIRDDNWRYSPGQQLKVKYAIDHPDMFAVIE